MTEGTVGIPLGESGELDRLHTAQVVILDAGSQFCGQIDRSVRDEHNVRSDILPLNTPVEELVGYKGIIISGGPDSVTAKDAKHCDPRIFELGTPILGICYGKQLMAHHLGGEVGDAGLREDGGVRTVLEDCRLFDGLEAEQHVWMSHGDSVLSLPEGFQAVGRNGTIITAMADEARKLYAVQFHPEVDDTQNGQTMISNFLFNIAEAEKDFTPDDQIEIAIAEIREVVGDRKVVLWLSGGVDSTVGALLFALALDKDQIVARHVDTGTLRADESATVKAALESRGINLEIIDASSDFFEATTVIDGAETPPLHAVTDPQVKRMIIGDKFADVFEVLVESLNSSTDVVLAQGTLRPDIIESGSHLAGTGLATIKTHHNDTQAIRALREQNRVCEPLKGLYKDQVRELGRRLGLPEDFVMRQPFPGPGLAIRVICTEEKLNNRGNLQVELDNYLRKQSHYSGEVMPFNTVGVQGDQRSYSALAVLRTDLDDVDWKDLIETAGQIPSSIRGINRVAFAFKNKNPSAFTTETYVNSESIDQLRHADAIVRSELTNAGLDHRLSQVPVILAPISYGKPGGRSIALRPFSTRDFMTGKPAVPGEDIPFDVLERIVERLLTEARGITQVLYDCSTKPPATTEWE